MATYQTKATVVEATQWFKNGDHPDDYAKDQEGLERGELRVFPGSERKAKGWEGGVVRYYRHPDVPDDRVCADCDHTMHVHGWIDDPHGGRMVCPGDYIITRGPDEYVPCKPLLFEQRYEAAQ